MKPQETGTCFYCDRVFIVESVLVCKECKKVKSVQAIKNAKQAAIIKRIVNERDTASLSDTEKWMLFKSGLLNALHKKDEMIATLRDELENKFGQLREHTIIQS